MKPSKLDYSFALTFIVALFVTHSATSLPDEVNAHGYSTTTSERYQSKEWWEQLMYLAQSGNVKAQRTLGAAYFFGARNLVKNLSKAELWLERAAEQDDPIASFQLYLMEREKSESFAKTDKHYLMKAADLDYHGALFELGANYAYGENPRLEKGRPWLAQTAKFSIEEIQLQTVQFSPNELPLSQEALDELHHESLSLAKKLKSRYTLAYALSILSDDPDDTEKQQAMELLTESASLGREVAQLLNHKLRENDYSDQGDYKRYLADWFVHALNGNIPAAKYELAIAHLDGAYGFDKDNSKGLSYLRSASEDNFPPAMHELGLAHSEGMYGMTKDYKKGIALLRRAAEAGYLESQFTLGVLLEYVLGETDELVAEAYFWLTKAAEGDFARAQFRLAFVLYHGEMNIESDPVASLEWMKRAANNNYARAQYALGKAYRDGKIVKIDEERSKYWFDLASKNGVDSPPGESEGY